MLDHNALTEVVSGIRSRIAQSHRIPTLAGLLATVSLAAPAAAQSGAEDFCSTDGGQLLGTVITILGAVAVMALIGGLLVGTLLESVPVTGNIARMGHRVVGGTLLGLLVLVVGYSVLSIGLGTSSVVDMGMSCVQI